MGLGFMLKIWIKQKAFAGSPLHFAFHFFKLLWLACNWVHKSRGLAPFLFTGWQSIARKYIPHRLATLWQSCASGRSGVASQSQLHLDQSVEVQLLLRLQIAHTSLELGRKTEIIWKQLLVLGKRIGAPG